MGVANSPVTNGPMPAEAVASTQSLHEELELAKLQIEALRKESEYYRKLALAMSRKAISAEALVEWL